MNTAYSFLRQRRRRPIADGESLPEQADGCPSPAENAAARELHGEIGKALAALPARLRAAISLTAIHGMSAAEAARVEGCLVATMYWRVHAARRRMGHDLRGYLET